MKYYLGIEIGSGKLHLAVADETNTVLEQIRHAVTPEQTADDHRNLLETSIGDLHTRYRFASVCVGFSGPVDWQQGKTIRSYRVNGWANFDLSDWLEDILRCPCKIENDANLAALAEALQGSGKNYPTVFYLKLGYGIGGGLIQKGQIYHGARPGESEIGKIRLDRSGTTLENVASIRSIVEKIKTEVTEHPDTDLAKAFSENNVNDYLTKNIGQDAWATQVMQETADHLAFGLSHVIHLLHPDLIIIGGGFLPLSDHLRSVIEKILPTYVVEAFRPLPKLAMAQLADEAVVRGALLVARQNSYL
ncbi:ROK family protein [Siphonobacter sp. SORGH_AS_0500]|uniref:ROK family protein n=1 Tax=Siphonobacter sp. SORGH_AS_0500 TaxID=1864824 RepID=UPI000CB31CBE|nr:ROK family protein [Siphonobacter sp. SORGH_AS_0500]MDR6194388.1 glucokinase [Siphonobacter sp. SORGH_AS_0500]PKK37688.1 hypothetical protein BWI96_04255 [Siphonobacter sp. SORGH_AS_0500]